MTRPSDSTQNLRFSRTFSRNVRKFKNKMSKNCQKANCKKTNKLGMATILQGSLSPPVISVKPNKFERNFLAKSISFENGKKN